MTLLSSNIVPSIFTAGQIHSNSSEQRRLSGTRRWVEILPLSLVLILSAMPVKSEETVPADPWEIIHIAREYGTADFGRDDMKDPKITAVFQESGSMPPIFYEIGFYGCERERECTAILFMLRIESEDWASSESAEHIVATWNREKLFGRAWIDDERRAVLDHPLAMRGGLPSDALRATFDSWRAAVIEYMEHVGFSGA